MTLEQFTMILGVLVGSLAVSLIILCAYLYQIFKHIEEDKIG